jgi:hypothetical protein
MKFLLWGLFIVLLIWLMRGKKPAAKASFPDAKAAAGGTERMRQCSHCDIFVPESEAIVAASGTVYCCEEHRLHHVS